MENQGSVISLESRQGWLAASKVVMDWGMDIHITVTTGRCREQRGTKSYRRGLKNKWKAMTTHCR